MVTRQWQILRAGVNIGNANSNLTVLDPVVDLMSWDVFISHASEDKDLVARPLADLLRNFKLSVWLDEQELGLGDSLKGKIDQGLAESRVGVVVLSHSFFEKKWPQRELKGLLEAESLAGKVILPVWHKVDEQLVAKYSPELADRKAANTAGGLGPVALQIADLVVPSLAGQGEFPYDRFYVEDKQLLEDLIPLFNRPAFRGTFLWQTDPNPFLRAMKLTLKALNTGAIQDNNGNNRRNIKLITDIRIASCFMPYRAS